MGAAALEDALEENETLFREIAQTTPVPVVISDFETGEFKFYNVAAVRLCREKLGFDISKRRTLDIWWTPEDRNAYVSAISKTQKIAGQAVAVKTDDGEKYWLEAFATVIDFLGRKCILTSLLDINDRFQAEQALRHAKNTLDRAQRITEMGSWEWNIATDEISWSDQIYRIFGYEVGAIDPTFHVFLQHVHEDDREMVQAAVKRALEDRAPYDINHRIVLPNGQIKILHEQGEVEYDQNGAPACMLGAVKDITDICETEEALRRSQVTLSGILNISPEAMIVTNEEGRITIFSAGAENIFGFSAEEVIGRRVDCLMPERARARHRDLVKDFGASQTASKQMGERREIIGCRKSGQEFPAKASLSKLQTPDGTYFTTILRDITEEKKHEAELTEAKKKAEAASEAKSAFLATMSHELRTPLNGVLGAAQILKTQNLDASAGEWIEMIRDSGENLLLLLNDILDICKIEEGTLSIAKQEFDLQQLFESVIAPRRLLADEKAVSLKMNTTLGDVHYEGDPKRIRQILTNLVNNAIKFTDQGEIVVTAKIEDSDGASMLVCSVKDTGCGVPEEAQAKIFDRFVQVQDGRSRMHNGAGLGLAICRELVNAMSGTMSLDSGAGQGSVFSFEIPIKPLRAVGSAKPPKDTERSPLSNGEARPAPFFAPSVLIVDDQFVNRKVIGSFVRAFGAEIHEAESGGEALERCRKTAFDLILMDIHMPMMCGQATLAKIRSVDNLNKATPVVAVTADAMVGDREKYLDSGFDAYLSKPVNAAELKSVISEFVPLADSGADKIAV